jgi:hypothetical protein
MTRRTIALLSAGLCALAAAAPATAGAKGLPQLTPAGPDALTRALARGKLSEADYALERARSLFELRGVRREFGDVERPDPREATPILRDLLARYRFLSASERATAGRILARPTDSTFGDEHHYSAPPGQRKEYCSPSHPLCFHWVESTQDAPPLTDLDSNGRPDDVDATIATFEAVYDLEVTAYGYLAPLPDTTSAPDNGGSGKTDIYLADLGGDTNAYFGYCTTDDPNAFDPSYLYYDVSAYCVVDEDFANPVFGSSATPQGFRDVTAAHEFFHAIQFHYDWLEDLWLMEGTAMVMEDQYADDVNDNVNYLANSVLTFPSVPVDRGSEGFEYGAWIWWRFLIEDLGQLANPVVIRQEWERVAAASTDTDGPGGPDTTSNDLYSLRGLRRVAGANGHPLTDLYGKFAWANRLPFIFYEEGDGYPKATVKRTYRLGGRGTSTGWRSPKLRHLSSTYTRFVPGKTTPANAVLRVGVHLPDLVYSPRAFLLVKAVGHPWSVRQIALNTAGDGVRRVGFGRGAIREVDLVLTNASTRMRCGRNTYYSCTGLGADDWGVYDYRGVVR